MVLTKMTPRNEIVLGDILEVLGTFDDESVDLVVTSPPYLNQRQYSSWPSYEAYMEDVEFWMTELYRVLKPGRHVLWNIPDKIPYPPKENGTREREYFPVYADTERVAADAGFVAEFPIIWDKRGPSLTQKPTNKVIFGSWPHPVGIMVTPFTERICVLRKRGKHGLSRADRDVSKLGKEAYNWLFDVWSISIERNSSHPAPFPLEIPYRCITLWSVAGELVLDPFSGSGTTALAAKMLGRDYVGIERNKDYHAMSVARVSQSMMF